MFIPIKEPLKLIRLNIDLTSFAKSLEIKQLSTTTSPVKVYQQRNYNFRPMILFTDSFLRWRIRVAKVSTKTFLAAQNQPSFINHLAHFIGVLPEKFFLNGFPRIELNVRLAARQTPLTSMNSFSRCSTCVALGIGSPANAKATHELVNKKAKRRESFLMEIVCDCC